MPKPTREAPSPPTSLAEQLDKKLAAEAYRKSISGLPLTDRERTALKRFEREKEERLRWVYYESIPQKHWRQMSGRQPKILREQAERYGIPFDGAVISLSKVARALHDFLAANARKLATDDDPLLAGGSSPALEDYRREKAALAKLDRLEREQQLVPRDQLRQGLGTIAGILRDAGIRLEREHGVAARQLLEESLDDCDRAIERMFNTNHIDDAAEAKDADEPTRDG